MLLVDALYQVGEIPFHSSFVQFLSQKGAGFCQMLFDPTKLPKLLTGLLLTPTLQSQWSVLFFSSSLTYQQHLSEVIASSSLKCYFYFAPTKSHARFFFYLPHFGFASCLYHHSLLGDLIWLHGFPFDLISTTPKSRASVQEPPLQSPIRHLYLTS